MGERCKVERTIEQYGLAGEGEPMDRTLLRRWRGEGDVEADGYRTLTDWFNRRLLKQVYDEHSRTTMAARVETDYELLTGDDDLARDELLADIARDGIDGDELRDDLVSWSTMRHHLQDCLDGKKPTRTGTTDWEADTVAATRESARSRVEKVLRSLDSKGKLPDAGDAELHVEFQLSCPHCPTRVSLDTAMERGYVCADHRA